MSTAHPSTRERRIATNGIELHVVEAGDGFPVNYYAGFYLEAGPGPAKGQMEAPAVDRVLAFDRAGKQIAQCRMSSGPGNTC